MNDAPRGDLAVEDHQITVSEFRDQEKMTLARGEEPWWILVRHDTTGQLVGLTTVTWYSQRPATVNQGDTAVRPEHGGKSLGAQPMADARQSRVVDGESADRRDIVSGVFGSR